MPDQGHTAKTLFAVVGVPTWGPGFQLVNPGSGRGAVRPAKGVCEGTVLSCTRSACCRGYKQGERGREAPKSLLGVESVGVSAQ